jgi:hypothetical protein
LAADSTARPRKAATKLDKRRISHGRKIADPPPRTRKPENEPPTGTAVILDIEEYREMLERLEDAEDLRELRRMRARPLKFRKLDAFPSDRAPVHLARAN